MAPNRFEKELKKKLDGRTIKPSTEAWDALSKKMDAAAPYEKKSNYFWYGIAAGFIGVLIVSVVYFSSESPVENTNVKLVDTNDRATETEAPSAEGIEGEIEEAVAETDEIRQAPAYTIDTADIDQVLKSKDEVTAVKQIKTVPDIPVEMEAMPNRLKEEIIHTKIMEIVAAVDSLEQDTDALTNAEVDSLLRNAQEELFRDKLFDQNGSVDAMALLDEVENELDKSFRDQIFESLKEGFLKVRTAVADRNK